MEQELISREDAFGLIMAKIDGSLLPDELEQLNKWVKASAENREIYQGFYRLNREFDEFSESLLPEAAYKRYLTSADILFAMLAICLFIYILW
ncbi:hypothetical protein [Hufsiella ginkgonis]|uniref:Anti-sigma factor n=1 Tax=Hufsiella ginkgonis TaxID=2695274 RepID=A0A7K1XVZ2_9SPHI|nr:hypothetical protein [Hufsiella ginkgonis]MXV14997.1 hypothetical protein [Hufsiella ginkgonis]